MKNFDDFIDLITPKDSENPVDSNTLISVQAVLDLLRLYHEWANGEIPSQH